MGVGYLKSRRFAWQKAENVNLRGMFGLVVSCWMRDANADKKLYLDFGKGKGKEKGKGKGKKE